MSKIDFNFPDGRGGRKHQSVDTTPPPPSGSGSGSANAVFSDDFEGLNFSKWTEVHGACEISPAATPPTP